jgi:2-polyprenyl-3-methyl-5-hydroxy-6-metoxy-1,4-benzoquinol methylase
MKDEQILDSWQHNAAAWSTAVREKRIESRRAGTDAAIVGAVIERGATKVLDAGCGEGWLARSLSEQGIDVVGFDGSAPLVERATAAGGGSFQVVTYEAFSETPAQVGADFDVVIFNFSLFTEDITPLLRAAAKTLRIGGALIIQTIHPFNDATSEPYVDAWRLETFASMGEEFRAPMPWYFRTMTSWLRSVTDAGLKFDRLREPINAATGRPLSLIIESVV